MGDPILDGVQQRQDPATPPTVPVDNGQTQQKEPGKFGKILGTVLGGAVSVLAPGMGSILGGLVRGGGLNYAADMETMLQQSARQQTQLLGVQMRVSDQTQQFTAVSNLLKAKHDGEMSAVNNFKSS
ncbi:MAG TPA: hypothetical protein VKB46_21185 [Pyrinomonadaceae bacterium]|nr:hypothetical protein [Pyrinomonadaceae bacterium]